MLIWPQPKQHEHWAIMPVLVRLPILAIQEKSDGRGFTKVLELAKVSAKGFNMLIFI